MSITLRRNLRPEGVCCGQTVPSLFQNMCFSPLGTAGANLSLSDWFILSFPIILTYIPITKQSVVILVLQGLGELHVSPEDRSQHLGGTRP